MSDHISTDHLYAFLDGELGDRRHQEVARHVAACDLCQDRLLRTEELFSSIESLPDQPLGRDLSPVIVAEIESSKRHAVELPWWVAVEALVAVGVLIAWWLINPKPATAIRGILDQVDLFMWWTRWALPRAIDIQHALQSLPDLLTEWVVVDPGDVWSPLLSLPWVPIVLGLIILWLITNGLLLTGQNFSSYPLERVRTRKGSNHG